MGANVGSPVAESSTERVALVTGAAGTIGSATDPHTERSGQPRRECRYNEEVKALLADLLCKGRLSTLTGFTRKRSTPRLNVWLLLTRKSQVSTPRLPTSLARRAAIILIHGGQPPDTSRI